MHFHFHCMILHCSWSDISDSCLLLLAGLHLSLVLQCLSHLAENAGANILCVFLLITFCFLPPFFLYYNHYQLCSVIPSSSVFPWCWLSVEWDLKQLPWQGWLWCCFLKWLHYCRWEASIFPLQSFVLHWHLLLLSFPAFFLHADHCSFQTPFWLEPQTRWRVSAVLLQTLFIPVWVISASYNGYVLFTTSIG